MLEIMENLSLTND